MEQKALGEGVQEGAQEQEVEEDRDYTRDVIIFLYKPVEWEGEEKPVSRYRRYHGLMETIANESAILPVVMKYEEIIADAGYDSLSLGQQNQLHTLRNLNISLQKYISLAGLTQMEALNIKDVLAKERISQEEFCLIIEYFQKVEQLFQQIKEKPQLRAAIFYPQYFLT